MVEFSPETYPGVLPKILRLLCSHPNSMAPVDLLCLGANDRPLGLLSFIYITMANCERGLTHPMVNTFSQSNIVDDAEVVDSTHPKSLVSQSYCKQFPKNNTRAFITYTLVWAKSQVKMPHQTILKLFRTDIFVT